MSRLAFLVLLAVSGLAASLPCAAQTGDGYKRIFRNALAARDRGQWAEAERLLRAALAENPVSSTERILLTGSFAFPYLPHYHLGEAVMEQETERCDEAVESFSRSRREGKVTAFERTLADLESREAECLEILLPATRASLGDDARTLGDLVSEREAREIAPVDQSRLQDARSLLRSVGAFVGRSDSEVRSWVAAQDLRSRLEEALVEVAAIEPLAEQDEGPDERLRQGEPDSPRRSNGETSGRQNDVIDGGVPAESAIRSEDDQAPAALEPTALPPLPVQPPLGDDPSRGADVGVTPAAVVPGSSRADVEAPAPSLAPVSLEEARALAAAARSGSDPLITELLERLDAQLAESSGESVASEIYVALRLAFGAEQYFAGRYLQAAEWLARGPAAVRRVGEQTALFRAASWYNLHRLGGRQRDLDRASELLQKSIGAGFSLDFGPAFSPRLRNWATQVRRSLEQR